MPTDSTIKPGCIYHSTDVFGSYCSEGKRLSFGELLDQFGTPPPDTEQFYVLEYLRYGSRGYWNQVVDPNTRAITKFYSIEQIREYAQRNFIEVQFSPGHPYNQVVEWKAVQVTRVVSVAAVAITGEHTGKLEQIEAKERELYEQLKVKFGPK